MTYDKEWYSGLSGARIHNERAMWALLAYLGKPLSMIDFGCGDGWMVRTAKALGVLNSTGVEVDESVLDVMGMHDLDIMIADLTMPVNLGKSADLVISFEVAEHLPESAADVFVETLVLHSTDILVFTAAKVGQGGYHHINCQDQPYWREKIERAGMFYDQRHSDNLRLIWQLTTGPLIWLPQNVQVFVKP